MSTVVRASLGMNLVLMLLSLYIDFVVPGDLPKATANLVAFAVLAYIWLLAGFISMLLWLNGRRRESLIGSFVSVSAFLVLLIAVSVVGIPPHEGFKTPIQKLVTGLTLCWMFVWLSVTLATSITDPPPKNAPHPGQ